MNLHEQCLLRYLKNPDELSYATEILKLNNKICDMYSSYYEFDSHDQGCWFDTEREKAKTDWRISNVLFSIDSKNDSEYSSFNPKNKNNTIIQNQKINFFNISNPIILRY